MSKFSTCALAGVIAIAITAHYFVPGKDAGAASYKSESAYTQLLAKAVRCSLPGYEKYATDNIRFDGSDMSSDYRITHARLLRFNAQGACEKPQDVPVDSIMPQDRPPVSNILGTDNGARHLFLILKGTSSGGEYTALDEEFVPKQAM